MAQSYREDLAYIHDAGFGQLARDAAVLLLARLSAAGFAGGLVVDLGCGGGILSEVIARAGYDVLGIDLSPEMVALARKRIPNGSFRIESILTAELPECVAVVAIGEVLCYRFDERHSLHLIEQFLAGVYQALVRGGLLLFDVVEWGRVPGATSYPSNAVGDDWAVLVATQVDEARQTLTRDITSFRRQGDHYRRGHEIHELRLLKGDDLADRLRKAGFEVEALQGYGSSPLAHGLRAFLARKPG